MRKYLAEAGLEAPEFEINGFFRAVFHRSPEFSLKGPPVEFDRSATQPVEDILLFLQGADN